MGSGWRGCTDTDVESAFALTSVRTGAGRSAIFLFSSVMAPSIASVAWSRALASSSSPAWRKRAAKARAWALRLPTVWRSCLPGGVVSAVPISSSSQPLTTSWASAEARRMSSLTWAARRFRPLRSPCPTISEARRKRSAMDLSIRSNSACAAPARWWRMSRSSALASAPACSAFFLKAAISRVTAGSPWGEALLGAEAAAACNGDSRRGWP